MLKIHTGGGYKLRLSDREIFELFIGKRVLNSELTTSGLPVYSANVFEPFGNIDSSIIDDFSTPSVIWGIDGDCMTNTLPADYPFYPTDHCGVVRIKKESVVEYKYLAWLLFKEGQKSRFSRSYRASIDRVSALTITVPSYESQKEAVRKIEIIEADIDRLEKKLVELNIKKSDVLNKYIVN